MFNKCMVRVITKIRNKMTKATITISQQIVNLLAIKSLLEYIPTEFTVLIITLQSFATE